MACSSSGRKVQEWQRRLKQFEKSRLSIKEFCRCEGVSQPSFYFWRKRLSQTPAAKQATAEPADAFRPVRLLPTMGVGIQLPGGTQLIVPTSDPESLRLVIDTLVCADAVHRGGVGPC